MVDPKFRLISMSFYCINQTLGIALVGIMGRYLHWKTVGYIMSVPMFVSISIALFWPESPFWLALNGEFEKCEIAFLWLRGNGVKARKELNELINSQKPSTKTISWKENFKKVTRKDFLVPSFQTFVCLCTFYCSGTLVLIIYSMDMIREATESEFAAFYGMISIDIILYIGCLTNAVLIKFFNNKTVFLCSSFGSAVCLFLASLVSYMQSVEVLSSDSLWVFYFLLAFMVVDSLGIATMTFTIAAEIMPVKYRDIGGAVYVILTCLLHFFSLKVSPYLFLYLGFSGTFLGFALNATFCSLYIWKFVPETKNRRLQEIENYYSIGYYDGRFNYEENEMLRSNF